MNSKHSRGLNLEHMVEDKKITQNHSEMDSYIKCSVLCDRIYKLLVIWIYWTQFEWHFDFDPQQKGSFGAKINLELVGLML